MMKRILTSRNLTALFAGNLLLFFLFSLVLFVLTHFEVTPYGKFVAKFFKGRTPEESKAFIEANRELFNTMLPSARSFSNLYILPSLTFVMGFVAGLIADRNRPVVGLLAALPLALLFMARQSGEPEKLFYVVMIFAASSVGAFAGGMLIERRKAEYGPS